MQESLKNHLKALIQLFKIKIIQLKKNNWPLQIRIKIIKMEK